MRQTNYLKQTKQMKTNTISRIVSLGLLLFAIVITTQAQVTIGSGEDPERGALLEHKERNATNPTSEVTSLENSKKGVLYPKVFLYDASKLTPLYGGSDTGSGVWSDESTADEKLRATGMVVYNVNPDAINMDDGLYMWQIDQWVKLNQDGAAIIAPVDCSAIRINGSFIQGVPMNDNNYVEVGLNITKKGSFVISILSGNGYSFYYSGVALQTGNLTVKVPAQGTPALVGENTLTFTGVSLVSGCEPKITVQEAIASYTMLCSSVIVQGQYYKGQVLTSSHVIKMNINVSETGSYNIYTETTNGISFKATGTFANVGTQQVTLFGTGVPTINEEFKVSIKSNTPLGSAECSATIPIILPAMTYAIIGNGVWSWETAARTDALALSGVSFNPNGVVRIQSFTRLWSTSSTSTATTNLANGVGGKYPDVVLYFAYGANPTAGLTTALLNYINAGGCVIYGSSDNTSSDVNILLSGLFGITTAQAQEAGSSNTSDNVYQIANNSSDPIINGPFGNLAGMYWGEDNASSGSVVMTSLPPNSVQICSAVSTTKTDINPAISIVWYNNNKNFVYFGDSTGASKTDSSTSSYPTIYNSTGTPVSKLYGPGSSNNKYVFNAALEFNCIAWAIKRAAVSGINPY